MIKKVLGTVFLLGFIAMMFAQAQTLFFSEYVEGSSNNKAIEIFNGTGAAVDLSQYSVKLGSNGNEWSSTNSVTLSGTLANNDVFVIANSSANATILGVADLTHTVTYFNGNDCLGLFQGDTMIDIIGIYMNNPGTAWDVAGVTGATLNHTLIRKPEITQGNTDWTSSAGTNADNSEWIVHEQDYVANLGMHTFNPGGGNHAATPTFNPPAGVYSGTISVSISSTTAGASIRYTTNGSEPTETSTLYTAPISVSSTTTIKARAYAAGMDPSYVASATYTFPTMIQNIAALRAANADGTTVYHIPNEVILTFQQNWRHQKYIQDATGGILVDDYPGIITTTYNIGDGITGITGTLSRYTTQMLQFWPTVNTPPASSTGNAIPTPELTIAQINADLETHQGRLVRINGVHFTSPTGNYATGQSYNIQDATGTMVFNTGFYDADYIGSPMHTGDFDLLAIVTQYNTTSQITARMLSDFNPGGATQVATPSFNPPAGTYVNPINVTISCATAGATIRYTTNGSDPTENSALYSTPIPISENTTIKARAYAADLDPSSIATAVYNFSTQQQDLFFSEYLEGSSNNKAIEIFNPTGTTADLSQYTVRLASNGNEWSSTNSVTLSGSLPNGAVYVIANAGASADILDVADITHTVTYFNGNDCLGLFHGETLIDIIGVYQENPGTAWPVAGVEGATFNHTLIRKPAVTQGNIDWASSAGTNMDDSEWLVHDMDYTADLGTHTYEPGGGDQVATPTFNPPAGAYSQPISVTISTTTPGATIRYTTNGNDPTESSTVYTAPIQVSSNTTIKAKAYAAGMDPSYIATATYSFAVEVQNLTQLRQQTPGDGTVYRVSGEVVLTAKQNFRNQKWLQDADAGIMIDDPSGIITSNYNIRDGIQGLTGTIVRYNNMLELVPTVNPGPPSSTGNPLNIPEVTTAMVNANVEQYQARLVRFENAHFVETGNFASGTNYTLEDNAGTIVFRTVIYEADYIGQPIPSGNMTIAAIVSQYNQTPQVFARMQSDLGFVSVDDELNAPLKNQLLGNYPNPFNPSTTIRFTLEKSTPAQVTIYNQKGQLVKSFTLDNPAKGMNSITWNGTDDNGRSVANGVYLFRLKSGSYTSTKKMVLMK